MAEKPTKPEGFWARVNRAVTEVGIEHFDDDGEWDRRVKLPAWQVEGLMRREDERLSASGGEAKIDAALALTAYQKIIDHGEKVRAGHQLLGISALTDPDGYGVTLTDGGTSARVLFHNQIALETRSKPALRAFRQKLVEVSRFTPT